MKCKDCVFKNNVQNTKETGSAICSYSESWFPVKVEDDCRFLPKLKKVTCGDCERLYHDLGCAGCAETDSAYINGRLCSGYVDLKVDDFSKILMFWKLHKLYTSEEIHKMIDDFDAEFGRLLNQKKDD